MKAKDVLGLAKDRSAVMVDLKFMDFVGIWQHFTIPIAELTEEIFEEGLGFDGSSIRGWEEIHASDMLVMPDPTTAVIDPFCGADAEPHLQHRRPDHQGALHARPAQHRHQGGEVPQVHRHRPTPPTSAPRPSSSSSTRCGSTVKPNATLLQGGLERGAWNTRQGERRQPRLQDPLQGRLLPGRPARQPAGHPHRDVPGDGRRGHQDRAAAPRGGHRRPGGDRLPLRHPGEVRRPAEWFKYIVKNVARRHGKTATFMPKPLFGDNGSGMHTHQSLWKNGKPLFAGDGYAGLTEMALYYIGGILKHARRWRDLQPDHQQLQAAGARASRRR